MARKVGEVFIDLFLRRDRFDRDVDQSARKAEDAGRKIEGSANRSARAYAALNTQVGALGQQLAGLSRVPGAGFLAGLGGAGAAGAGGLAALSAAFFQNQQEVAFRNQQRNDLAQLAASGLGAIGSVQRSALTPSQQRAAEFRARQADFIRANNQGLVSAFDQQSQGIGPIRQGAANIIRGLQNTFKYTDVSRLLPGPYSATSVIGNIADFVGLDDNIQRELDKANTATNAFSVNNRRLIEETERAIGITSNPAFGAASTLDDMRTMIQYQQETTELLKQLVQQGSAPQPGGATP